MRNSSSPSLAAPLTMVVIVVGFMAAALLSVGQSTSAGQADTHVASIEASARQG